MLGRTYILLPFATLQPVFLLQCGADFSYQAEHSTPRWPSESVQLSSSWSLEPSSYFSVSLLIPSLFSLLMLGPGDDHTPSHWLLYLPVEDHRKVCVAPFYLSKTHRPDGDPSPVGFWILGLHTTWPWTLVFPILSLPGCFIFPRSYPSATSFLKVIQ